MQDTSRIAEAWLKSDGAEVRYILVGLGGARRILVNAEDAPVAHQTVVGL